MRRRAASSTRSRSDPRLEVRGPIRVLAGVTLEEAGLSNRFRLPSRRFHRHIGIYAGSSFDPLGRPLSEAEWNARRDGWLPSARDKEVVRAVQKPVLEAGKMAHWIAPPARGINGLPWEYEYVKRAV